jgi:hypothetical protein
MRYRFDFGRAGVEHTFHLHPCDQLPDAIVDAKAQHH